MANGFWVDDKIGDYGNHQAIKNLFARVERAFFFPYDAGSFNDPWHDDNGKEYGILCNGNVEMITDYGEYLHYDNYKNNHCRYSWYHK